MSPKDSLNETQPSQASESTFPSQNTDSTALTSKGQKRIETVTSTQHETRKQALFPPCAAAAGQRHADATYIGRALSLDKPKWAGAV